MNYYFTQISVLLVVLLASVMYENYIRYNKLLALEAGSATYFTGPIAPWVMVFGYLALLSGMRIHMNDTGIYMSSFEYAQPTWDAFQSALHEDIKYAGTDALQVLFKMFVSRNFHVWFLTWAVIESCLFVNVLRRETVSFADACFFFAASTLYYNYFTMMRQWMAVAITFWGARYLRDGYTRKYIAICLVAAVFHPSAIFMVMVFFLVRGKAWNIKQMGILAALAIGMVFMEPILAFVSDAAVGTTYDYAIDTLNTNSGSSIVRGAIAAVPVLIAFFNRKQIDDSMINTCVNISLLNMMMNIFAAFTNGLNIIRLATYLEVYNVILYSYLLNISIKNRKIIKVCFYLFYLVFFIYQHNYSNTWRYRSDVLTWLSNY